LYNQWTEHRVEIAKEQYRRLVKKTGGRKQVGREFDIEGVRAQIEVFKNFLARTSDQLVWKEDWVSYRRVDKGEIDK